MEWIKRCRDKGKPGYKYGDVGKCYTYTVKDVEGREAAKRKAELQGREIRKGRKE